MYVNLVELLYLWHRGLGLIQSSRNWFLKAAACFPPCSFKGGLHQHYSTEVNPHGIGEVAILWINVSVNSNPKLNDASKLCVSASADNTSSIFNWYILWHISQSDGLTYLTDGFRQWDFGSICMFHYDQISLQNPFHLLWSHTAVGLSYFSLQV